MASLTKSSDARLRRHADYGRVYGASRKQFSRQMSYFFTGRSTVGAQVPAASPSAALTSPRVGLTVGKVMGKAVDRNRIKRRMREAIRRNLPLLQSPLDVILHPRRSVIDLDFDVLCREVASVFQTIQGQADREGQTRAPRAGRPHPTAARRES